MIKLDLFKNNQLLGPYAKIAGEKPSKPQYKPPLIKVIYSNELIKGHPTDKILESDAGQYGG